MAIMNNGSIFSFKGKIGNLVFCNWKGQTYVRSAPESRKRTKSTLQLGNNSKFKQLQELLSKILPYIRLGFKNYHPEWSSHNSAMSYNLKNAFDEHSKNNNINWSSLSISRGLINPITTFNIEMNLESTSLKVLWTYDEEIVKAFDMENYRCMLLLQPENTEINKVFGLVNGNLISEESQEIYFDKLTPQDIYHVYLAFLSNDGSYQCTDSKYLGKI
ncbi:DUF6266 family protein [Sphingobacterium sp. WM]|uniref:DUF6266 family protein n=1 Tax=Sphingobacterium sp. WM TaxID=3031802 RepID=UPI00240DB04A|nr:DUF6266 family protein [Sphingobacterium sp. WM]WFB62773.1 DUF6266 family protein [Sphingobacterium sp. WM]